MNAVIKRLILSALAIVSPALMGADQAETIPKVRSVDLSRFSPGARAAYERVDWDSPSGASHIVGFNYQPSWAETGVMAWIDGFDAAKYRKELENAKRLFPAMNTVRIWLNYRAWEKNPEIYLRNVRTAFEICRELDLLMIPTLTSFWPGNSDNWGMVRHGEDPAKLERMEEYFLAVNEVSAGGANVFVWDICNEPQLWVAANSSPSIVEAWRVWLRKHLQLVRERFDNNKVTIGFDSNWSATENSLELAALCDVWSAHFYNYLVHDATIPEKAREFRDNLPELKKAHRQNVKGYIAAYAEAGIRMPIYANETCWGSLDDSVRAEIVEASLSVLVDMGVGFTVHALQESLAPDLHRPDLGQHAGVYGLHP